MKCWILILFSFWPWSYACDKQNLLTCKSYESIVITDASNCSLDESITFDGVTYPKGTYGVLYGEVSILRGCICNIKPCARLCCAYGQILDNMICKTHESALNFDIQVKVRDQPDIVKLDQNKNYALLEGPNCKNHFSTDGNFEFSKVFFNCFFV